MNEIISCPSCGLSIKISCECKIELYDYPIKTVIEFLNEKILEEEKKIALKKVIKNDGNYKAEVTTKLTDTEIEALINNAVGYCGVCGRANTTFGLLVSSGLPRLYEGQMIAGGIGPTCLSYTNGVITAHDPVPDVTVKLNVVRGKKIVKMKYTVEVPPQQTQKFLIALQQHGGTIIYYRLRLPIPPSNHQLLFYVEITQSFALPLCIWHLSEGD